MIKFFHKYHKSVIGIIFLGVISLAMLTFGLPTDQGVRNQHAIKINDSEIYLDEITRRKREVQDRYRSIFGEQYFNIAAELEKNLASNVVDSVIDEQLLIQFADQIGMAPGQKQLVDYLGEQLGGFTPEKYAALLSQARMTATQFEARLESELMQGALEDMLKHVSFATDEEAKRLYLLDQTAVSVEYVSVTPDDFKDAISLSEEEIQTYFEENIVEYEKPSRAKYNFAKIEPSQFADQVEVFEEDIDFFYSDNQKRFRIPAERLVRIIRLKKDEGESDEDLKTLAGEIEKRFSAGEDAGELAKQFSEDEESKADGGLLGWKKRGELDRSLDSDAFEMTAPSLRQVEDGDDVVLLFVEGAKDESVQPLEEVKAEIEQIIRDREAPAYAAALALEVFEEWKQGGKTLEEFSNERSLTIVSAEDFLSEREDPEGMRGLSREVIDRSFEAQQLVQTDRLLALVELVEYKEREFPSLEEVADDVTEDLKAKRARDEAKAKAEEITAAFQDETTSLTSIGDLLQKELKTKESLKRGDAEGVPFSDPSVREALFAEDAVEGLIKQRFNVGGTNYFLAITKREAPSVNEADEKLTQYKNQATNQLFAEARRGLINRLKSKAEVDIQPFVYN